MTTRFFIVALLLLGVLHATPVALTDDKGNSISVSIVSATETSVTVKREKDGREFTIGLDTLDGKSGELVNRWMKLNATIPTEQKSYEFKNGASFKLEFKLPKYDFEHSKWEDSQFGGSQDTYSFEGTDQGSKGELVIVAFGSKTSLEEISIDIDKLMARKRASFSPEELKEKSELLQKHKFESKNFNGFYISHVDSSGKKRIYTLTSGKVYLKITLLSAGPDAPINFDNIEAIISTMEVTSFQP